MRNIGESTDVPWDPVGDVHWPWRGEVTRYRVQLSLRYQHVKFDHGRAQGSLTGISPSPRHIESLGSYYYRAWYVVRS